jgi:low temperature requirement protein LtrA
MSARARRPLRWPMVARRRDEPHRTATPLELFFDLCFVVAIAQASGRLHHALASEHFRHPIVQFLLVFFAIWWAWMNYTWFASAYDNDDVVFRLLTFVEIAGALIIAAGVPRAFDASDFDIIYAGYLVMRAGLTTLWLRAAAHDPPRRTTALRFAAGVSLCMVGWTVVFLLDWPLWAFAIMAVAELAVPIWAERAEPTTWHPHHISERYGLFTLIVLGEAVASASVAVQEGIDHRATSATLYLIAVGGMLIVFSMWSMYFAKPIAERLVENRLAFLWGYGHYFVFAAAAAAGAGIAVNVDQATHESDLSRVVAGATITVPVAVYLLAVWFLHVRPNENPPFRGTLLPVGAVLVLLMTFTGQPVVATGLVLTVVVAIAVVLGARSLGEVVVDRDDRGNAPQT